MASGLFRWHSPKSRFRPLSADIPNRWHFCFPREQYGSSSMGWHWRKSSINPFWVCISVSSRNLLDEETGMKKRVGLLRWHTPKLGFLPSWQVFVPSVMFCFLVSKSITCREVGLWRKTTFRLFWIPTFMSLRKNSRDYFMMEWFNYFWGRPP